MVAEQEPNDSPEKAQKISLPCEVVGRFYPHGDQDVYTFDAQKGDAYWMEIFSERLGEPTSPELLVQKVNKSPKGEEQINDVQDLGGPDMAPAGKKTGGRRRVSRCQPRYFLSLRSQGSRGVSHHRSRLVQRDQGQRVAGLSPVDP